MIKPYIFLITLFIAGFAQAQERPVHEIHAAMVYNFIKYVQWPDEAESGDFVVGVMGDDNVYKTLQAWYGGKTKGTKKYVIRQLYVANEAAECQVVYLGKSRSREFSSIKSVLGSRSTLTITDANGLGQKGSCLNFRVIDGKLKFECNQGALNAASLKVSNQLSSMAIVI